jgi:hypothetical protein
MLQRSRAVAAALAAALLLAPAFARSGEPFDYEATRVAPIAVTPTAIVDEMLRMAAVGPDDFVVDLGSGDGRLVIAAVRQFGARGGFGVDITASAVDYANAKAAEQGVADRVRFMRRDLFATDISPATVVTVYLFPAAMPRLREKLLADLRPGTRVVSHDFPLPDWKPDRIARFAAPDKNDSVGRNDAVLYLYTVPPRAGR